MKIKFARPLKTIILVSLASLCSSVYAIDLMQALTVASQTDPIYQEAVATYQSEIQVLPQARAQLLPNLDLNGAIHRRHLDNPKNGDNYYTTNDFGLNVQQKIFDFGAFQNYRKAQASVKAAMATLLAANQDLMVRVAGAYYGVLESQKILRFTKQQLQFISQQLAATKKRYQHKEATATELQQAQGAYDNIVSDLATAKINLNNSIQALAAITAHQYRNFSHLNGTPPLVLPKPNQLLAWVNKARLDNLTLRAAHYSQLAAKQNIHQQEGGYLPTVTADAGYNIGRDSVSKPNDRLTTQHQTDAAVGLNANWNLYQGGFTQSKVQQAIALYQAAIAQSNKAYLDAITETREAYQAINYGRAQVQADNNGLRSNQNALINAEKGYRAGVQTITDVLQIQNQLFQSQKKYATDVYQYLLNILRLKQAAGILNVRALRAQNSLLK